eukprot:m.102179 g.102179  ORF g.102179 m.102179 type:complete len:560 (+) comp10428_c0_seq1:35-1714(+)
MQLSRSGAGGMWLVVAVAAGLGGTTPVAAAAMDTQPREKFTSASRYIGLYGVETSLVSALEDYVAAEQRRVDEVRAALEALNRTVTLQPTMTEQEHTAAAAHAVATRLSELATRLSTDLLESRDEGISVWYENNTEWIPTNDDVAGIRDGLLRAQRTYNLPAEVAASHFTFVEMVRMAQHAAGQQDWPTALEWFKVAETAYIEAPNASALPAADVLAMFDGHAYAAYKMGNLTQAIMLSEDLLHFAEQSNQSTPRLEFRINDNIESYNAIMTRVDGDEANLPEGAPGSIAKRNYNPDNLLRHDEDEMAAYRHLCRQKGSYTNASIGKLLNATYEASAPRSQRFFKDTCKLVTRGKASLMLQPAKVEMITGGEPKVKLFREFLTEAERVHIMSVAKDRLQRSVASNGSAYVPTQFRISEVAWIEPNHDPIIERVHRRIADATGLNLEFAEQLQVSNYGIAGHYEPHMDWGKRSRDHPEGMRLATFMLYLADVELGGNTVFPNLGVSVSPSQRDAIFWHNLHLDTFDGNKGTLHGGCPVYAGSKWVANKWVHEGGNNVCLI